MDYLGDQGLICKAKSILSSLCGILLWVSRLHEPSPVHSPKDFPTHNCDLQLGFKTLIYLEARSPRDPNHFVDIVHSYMISSASSSYSSGLPSLSPSLLRSTSTSTSSSNLSAIMLGDLIGTESGVYLSSNEDEIKGLEKSDGRTHDHKPNQRYRAHHAGTRSNHYPPPIPLLAQTGNLPGRMPWVFTRHYGDGKLILKVERVKHHEYLEAHRENGRLILNLVPLDEYVESEEEINHDDQELELEDLHDHFEDDETDHEKIHDDHQEVEIQYQEPEVVYDDNYTHVDHDEIVAEEDLMMTSLAASSIPVKIWLENGIMISSKRYDDESRSLPKSSSTTTTTERSENLRKCFTNNADVFINPNAMLISTNAFAHA